jgi:hypothetical protein
LALVGLMKIIASNKAENKLAPKFMQVITSIRLGVCPDEVTRKSCTLDPFSDRIMHRLST